MQRIIAALTFFTRIPLWRIVQVDSRHYSRVVELWSAVGWITGGVMALTLWLTSMVLPIWCAVTCALLARTILTGALHEDGLADFCDGMGGGTSRERIMEIMKDSHIGTYGVIGLIFYYLLSIGTLASMPCAVRTLCAIILAADVWSKFCAAQIINVLPYARTAEQAKNRTVYKRFSAAAMIFSLVISVIPLYLLGYPLALSAIAPAVTSAVIFIYLHYKLQGYTGDCCGATFLIAELSFYITAAALV